MLQHGEVLGDGRAGDVEVGRDLAGAQLAVAHEREDLAAAGLGDRAGNVVHGPLTKAAAYVSVNHLISWIARVVLRATRERACEQSSSRSMNGSRGGLDADVRVAE